jgi:uncharacterized protein (DUF427 family)
MSLTVGTGPFGHHPAGDLNSRIEGPKHTLYFEDYPRRMRAVLGGETVIDTVRGKLLWESSIAPVLYVPIDDVRADLIEPTSHSTHCPFKGDASYWTVRAGDRVAENALWTYREPIDSAPWLLGYVAAYWDKMDAWYEEAERLEGKLRDPYHRIDVRDADARVTVRAGGQVIAESRRPKLLFETGAPPRVYLPFEDVRSEAIVASSTSTHDQYKGTAAHWSVRHDGGLIEDALSVIAEPLPEAEALAGLASFGGEGIEVELEREPASELTAAA